MPNLTGIAFKMWAYRPQNLFPKVVGLYPLSDFLQNLAWRRESQVRTLTANFTVLALKMWAYSPQIVKNGNNFPLKENRGGP